VKNIFDQKIGRMVLVLLVFVVFSCAAPPKKPTEPKVPIVPKMPLEKDPFSILSEKYRNKAMEYEKDGELWKALKSWEIVAGLTPADDGVSKKIETLRTQVQTMADQHFKRGLSYYQTNSMEAARKEFLTALYYNPNHQEALNYLKHKLPGEDYILYQVKGGDTLKEISKKTYHDPNKDFLIAYFNDLRVDTKLVPGRTLRLPLLESTTAKSTIEPKETAMDAKEISADAKELMSKALAYYKVKNYRETVSVSEKVLEYDPANKEAHQLINESYYQMGKSLSKGKKYKEALDVLDRLDPGYKDVRESVAFVKKQLAGEHYLRGVKYYTDEELDKAIKEWEITLTLDPNHPKAKKDIDNARALLQKLKELK
jgi:tetratricopeptide (TPR) repeat protein